MSDWRLQMTKDGAYRAVNNQHAANTLNKNGKSMWETNGKFKGYKTGQKGPFGKGASD
jgi:hypothetical protein